VPDLPPLVEQLVAPADGCFERAMSRGHSATACGEEAKQQAPEQLLRRKRARQTGVSQCQWLDPDAVSAAMLCESS
jgi:hypothetical protein